MKNTNLIRPGTDVVLTEKLTAYPILETNVVYNVLDVREDGRILLRGGDTAWYPSGIFQPYSSKHSKKEKTSWNLLK
jgi:hypothetical protein